MYYIRSETVAVWMDVVCIKYDDHMIPVDEYGLNLPKFDLELERIPGKETQPGN